MANKLSVGILYGGRSVEHQISVRSAKNVFQYIDKDKYSIQLIGIDKSGKWHLMNTVSDDFNSGKPLQL